MGKSLSRAEFSRRVFQHLAKPEFRDRLDVRLDDGTVPVVTAMPDDMLSRVVEDVTAAGGQANVVICWETKFMILAMSVHAVASAAELMGTRRLDECTVTQFVGRLVADGPGKSYRFSVASDGAHASEGSASLKDLTAA